MKKYRILIVEDDYLINRFLMEILSSTHTLKSTFCGQDALSIAREWQPDIVLLDVMMPGMDGFEVCQELKNNPITQNAIVIYLSAKHETADRLKGYECGGDDFIAKPFDPLELQAKVAAMCKCVEERKV